MIISKHNVLNVCVVQILNLKIAFVKFLLPVSIEYLTLKNIYCLTIVLFLSFLSSVTNKMLYSYLFILLLFVVTW